MVLSLAVAGLDGGMDGVIEGPGVGEGPMSGRVGFAIVPGALDAVEPGSVSGQPFYGEPMGAGGQGGRGRLADVGRPGVEHDHDRPGRAARARAVEPVALVQA